MQVILLENIIKLGKIGDLVEVKNGYGRNFLLKSGKALRYTFASSARQMLLRVEAARRQFEPGYRSRSNL